MDSLVITIDSEGVENGFPLQLGVVGRKNV
jgi:hypothetical protein